MGIIETLFGDFILALMQAPLWRWGAAFVVSFWVWGCGNPEAIYRKSYLFTPFILAAMIEIADLRLAGGAQAPGGWLPYYIWTKEALKHLASLAGLISVLAALLLGVWAGFAYALVLSGFLAVYVAERQLGGGFSLFSFDLLRSALGMLPTILIVLMVFYGLGACIRRFLEFRRRHA